jgi:hypothetical protein
MGYKKPVLPRPHYLLPVFPHTVHTYCLLKTIQHVKCLAVNYFSGRFSGIELHTLLLAVIYSSGYMALFTFVSYRNKDKRIILGSVLRIRMDKCSDQDPGSGKKHPGSATLLLLCPY